MTAKFAPYFLDWLAHPSFDDYWRQWSIEDHYADIKFLNLQRVWEEHNYFPGSLVDGAHLSNDGHKLITTYLSDWLLPFAQDRCAQLDATKAGSPQHVN